MKASYLGLILACAAPFAAGAESGDNPALFARAGMTAVELPGVRVWLGTPVQVTAQIGWKMEWPHVKDEPDWSFIHLTPSLARFPGGNLVAAYALDPDTDDNPFFNSAVQFSRDGGAHWGRRYNLVMQHNPMIFLPKPNDSLLAVPSEFVLQPGNARTFIGSGYLFEHGGDRVTILPDGIRVLDWPWDVAVIPSSQPQESWMVEGLTITGSALPSGSRLLATAYGDKKGESHYAEYIVESADGGYTWRYRSTIAEADPAQFGDKNYEGPNEGCMIRLPDGELMAIFRLGSGHHLLRSYSRDEGATWTKADALPAVSVKPDIVRTANGVTALTTGRPGTYLWVSTDPRATQWASVDLIAHHNRWARDPSERIGPLKSTYYGVKWQTTSYTAIAHVGPNRLVIVYDRDPEQAPANPQDLSRVYVVPVEFERK